VTRRLVAVRRHGIPVGFLLAVLLCTAVLDGPAHDLAHLIGGTS